MTTENNDIIYHKMLIPTRGQYDALNALNCSGAKSLLISPQHYLFETQHKDEEQDSKALKLGRAVHSLVLEPKTFDDLYVVAPEIDRRTKEGKKQYEDFTQANLGKEIISAEDLQISQNIKERVDGIMKKNGITFAQTEYMIAVPFAGIMLKSAIDAVGDDGYLYDLKTTDDASPQGFMRSVRNFRYNLQAYFYRFVYEHFMGEGFRIKGFRFIVCEKTKPGVAIYELGLRANLAANDDFHRAVQIYNECQCTGVYNGYPSLPQEIDFPERKSEANSINFV